MIGKKLGSYKITREIGAGGMGKVYAAEHELIGRHAAVKVLQTQYSENKAVTERFFNEARAATRIRHAGIVSVFEFGYTDEGNAFILMELLEGESLSSRIEREKLLSEEDMLRLCRQIASAIAAAHHAGIVHRDLKPDNVFIVPDSEVYAGERIKVLDFGIAKLTGDSAHSVAKTNTGMILGSPLYMSPEQCADSSNVDHRADIYSLGCVMYHMLCGAPPFTGSGSGRVIAQHIYEAPKPLREHRPTLRPELEAIVLRAIAKDPDARFASMEELAQALDSAGAVSISMPPGGSRSWAATDRPPSSGQRASQPHLHTPSSSPKLPGVSSQPWLDALGNTSPSMDNIQTVESSGSLPQVPRAFDSGMHDSARPTNRTIGTAKDSFEGLSSFDALNSNGTLGGAASQLTPKPPVKKGRGKMWLALAALIAVAGGAAIAVLSSTSPAGHENATQASATAPNPSAAPSLSPTPALPSTDKEGSDTGEVPAENDPLQTAAAAGDKAGEGQPASGTGAAEPDKAVADETVKFRIVSKPGRALVRDGEGNLLGETPYEVAVPKDGQTLVFDVEKAGYRIQSLNLTADRDREKQVELQRLRRGEKRKPPQRKATGDKANTRLPGKDPDRGRNENGEWGETVDPLKE